MDEIFKCKYCGKIAKNKSGNSYHENRCKNNPNRIVNSKKIWITKDNLTKLIDINLYNEYLLNGWSKYKRSLKAAPNKNKKCINNGISNKYVSIDTIEEYLLAGWKLGSFKYETHSTGRASTPDLEIIRRQKISQTMKNNPLCGGYRKGAGNGKSGWYKGIHCDSTWELAFLIYHLDNNLYIERCKEKRKYFYNGEEHIYIPDFVTDKGIIEIKGYKSKQWEAKEKYNKDIIVLYESDVKKYIEYCLSKYNVDDLSLLYDN